MKLLLDTHALLWFVWDHANLSENARNLMNDPDNELLLSTGTIWEIAIKVGLNKLTLAEPYEDFMNRAIADNDLTVLETSVKHAAMLTTLPFHHRDPFDRLIIAQAIAEGIIVVSGDTVFDAYPVTRLW
jgi:PIN domain nuclease of toxin-antitoxin system